MVKPGYKTSEFWFTLASFLCSGLYLLGALDKTQQDDTTETLTHAMESIVLISGQAVIFWKYINSRSEVKKAFWNSSKEKKNVSKRISNKRSPKTNRPNKTSAK